MEPSPLRISEMAEVFVSESKLYVCRGRCPHRPVRICCFTVMFGKFVIFIGPMWASAPTSLRKSHTLRIPYVKYSTGANEATRTVYRAIGKPDSTAAQRAFGRWKRNDSMHNETTSFSGASALFRSPASLFCILFSDKPEKSMSAKRYRTNWVQKGGCNAIPASISRRAVGPQSH